MFSENGFQNSGCIRKGCLCKNSPQQEKVEHYQESVRALTPDISFFDTVALESLQNKI